MDDIILIGDHMQEINTLKSVLAKEFEIKVLRSLRYFLGIDIARLNAKISLSTKICNLLHEIRMLGCNQTNTPMDLIIKLGIKKRLIDKGRY